MMLYGMEMGQSEWKLDTYKASDYLVFSKDSRMYPKIPAHYFKDRLKLFGADGDYHYYVFSFQEKPRFIFIAKEPINFASVDLPLNRQESEIALIVEGALYDIWTERFLTFEKNGIFFKYVLYDSGVPHVIFDESNGTYSIMTISSRRTHKYIYKKVSSFEDPQFVSYIYKDQDTLEIKCMRVIFYKDEYGKDNMLVLSDEIVKELNEENVVYNDTISTASIVASDGEYYDLLHKDEDVPTDVINEVGYFVNNHIVFGDVLVVRVSTGEWKEYVFVRLANGEVEFDSQNTFFSYKKVYGCSEKYEGHNLIEFTWRRNDFENASAIFDVTLNKYHYDLSEFTKDVTSA